MTTDTALAVARDYHDAWSSGDFDRAVALLADDLEVEVPINDYPTTASFAAALRGFGSTVTHAEILSAMGSGDEAMLLYDMVVASIGTMRICEHFTVADGRIERLRQIHDTAALRAAGVASAAAS